MSRIATRSLLGSATIAVGIIATPVDADPPFVLELPLACEIGTDCFIQQYFDHDPGPGAKDYRCGSMVYDGHDGVDIRVPTIARQKRGVAVVAAAGGVVQGTRDGMADVNVTLAGPTSVAGRECGNGVMIRHAGGWQTQYCHMAKGSLRVTSGQQVAKGTVLGQIGESGDAAFPHLHFSVRRNGVKVDPFAVDAAAGQCGTGRSLWLAGARAALAYHSSDVINTGFASGVVTMDDVESGQTTPPLATGPALVAFVRAIGLQRGDVQTLTLSAPDGAILARNAAPPLDHDKAQWLLFAGKKLTAARWPAGSYAAIYQVERGGRLVLTRRFAFPLK